MKKWLAVSFAFLFGISTCYSLDNTLLNELVGKKITVDDGYSVQVFEIKKLNSSYAVVRQFLNEDKSVARKYTYSVNIKSDTECTFMNIIEGPGGIFANMINKTIVFMLVLDPETNQIRMYTDGLRLMIAIAG